jgi:predicted 3-demethylubiquinone-9 3-methyltransferase (glyoxalase superfamily)
MPKIRPSLWFDGNAEEAAKFYVSLLPDSHVDDVYRSPADNPSTKAGAVLVVNFTVAGQQFSAINGGPQFPFTEAVSFEIDCEDQAEVDRLWDTLTADGGSPGQCGWLKDRFGLSWQVLPRQMGEMLGNPDPDKSRRAMEAMLRMTKIDLSEMRRAMEGEPVA